MKHLHTFEDFLNEGKLPQNAPSVVKAVYKEKKYVEITPATKLAVKDDIIGMRSGTFYSIHSISGDKIQVNDHAFGDVDDITREDLEKYYLIKKK